jgi:hypothetical protein
MHNVEVNLAKIAELTHPIPKHKLFLSIAIGGLIGGLTSLIINACLLEITLNAFFTTVSP